MKIVHLLILAVVVYAGWRLYQGKKSAAVAKSSANRQVG